VTTAAYPVESIDNAARILLAFRTKRQVRVSEMAAELSVARSTAHRMLTTLADRGLVRQDPETKAYVPGPALIELGLAVIGVADLRAVVRPVLERLAETTGETVHLLVLEGSETVFLDGVESPQVIRASLRTGVRGPAHASAAGKAMLSLLDREDVLARFPGGSLHGGTAHAISSWEKFEAELQAVREQGYAVNLQESEPGLHAVSLALTDSSGTVRGALSVSGPAERMGRDLTRFVAPLRAAAADLRYRLGG
jgi:IclR family transcriptional regulator, acetate operon repressor